MSEPLAQNQAKPDASENQSSVGRRSAMKFLGIGAIAASGGGGVALADTISTPIAVGNTPSKAELNRKPVEKLTPDDGDTSDFFGRIVGVHGNTIIVAAPVDEDPNGDRAGSAYVFTRSGRSWNQTEKLTPNDGDADDFFAASLAIHGNIAVLGAPWDEDPNGDRAGSAYVFTRSGGNWYQEEKLTPEDGHINDGFGDTVAIHSNTVVISASDSAYVFTRESRSWNEQQKLIPDASSGSLAVHGNTALMGASRDGDPPFREAGSTYVFSRSGRSWHQSQKLTPDDRDGFDNFGKSVAVHGNTAVIGAYFDEDPSGDKAGSAYVFSRSGRNWHQEEKLTPDGGDEFDNFGRSVAVHGNTAVIGAYHDEDPNGVSAGSAYVFTRSGRSWNQTEKLTPNDGDDGDFFGRSVAVHGNTAVIGAPNDEDPNGHRSGSAYVFQM